MRSTRGETRRKNGQGDKERGRQGDWNITHTASHILIPHHKRGEEMAMKGEPAYGRRHSVRIDFEVLNHRGISGGELRLYALILKWDGGNGCSVGEGRLARDLGKSVRTVQRYLRNLKSFGLVRIQQRGRGSTALLRCS